MHVLEKVPVLTIPAAFLLASLFLKGSQMNSSSLPE
jgi:hypothetical protein